MRYAFEPRGRYMKESMDFYHLLKILVYTQLKLLKTAISLVKNFLIALRNL